MTPLLVGSHSNFCIFVALVNEVCINFALNFCNVTVSVNNAYRYFVVSVDRTFSWIKCKILGVVRIYNSQFNSSTNAGLWVKTSYSDAGTKQTFICFDVFFSCKEVVCIMGILTFCIAVETKYCIGCSDLDAVFIDIGAYCHNSLAKGNFAVKLGPFFAWRNARVRHVFMTIEVNFERLGGAIFSDMEGSSCIVAAFKCYTYRIGTRDEIRLFTSVVESILIAIWN